MNALYIALGTALIALGLTVLMIHFTISTLERAAKVQREAGRREKEELVEEVEESEGTEIGPVIAAMTLPIAFALLVMAVATAYPQYALILFAALPLVLLATALIALSRRGRVEGGAVVIIGPVPIVLSSSRSLAKVLILMALITYLIFVAVLLLYTGWRP